MTPLPWYFDVISPYAYLQLEWLQRDHAELVLDPRPVVLGAVLAHHGQLGPAEIPGKREFTYRYVLWRAHELGLPLKFPPRHPFNPLSALRLILAAGCSLQAVQAVFRHIWRDGHAADTIADLAPAMAELGVEASSLGDATVKDALRASTEAALAAGVFGVPTLVVNGDLYFGQDATPFALAALAQPQMLQQGEYARLKSIPVGVQRR